jgi:hypothetical protein
MVAPLIIAGVAAGASLVAGMNSARAQRKAGATQAKLIRAETDETVRRMEIANRQRRKQAVGAGYASGIQMSGSNEQYIRTMQQELARELAWTKQAGYMAARAAKKGANVSARASQLSSAAGALSQFSGAFGAFGK